MATATTMDGKGNVKSCCFLCSRELSGEIPCSKEDSIILFEILEVPHLFSTNQEFKHLKYCTDCSDRIIKVEIMLEELSQLEKRVLDEKFAIEMQLKKSLKKTKNEFPCSDKLRAEVTEELRLIAIKSTLGKIRKKQIGRMVVENPLVNIMQKVKIPPLVNANCTNSNTVTSDLEVVKTDEQLRLPVPPIIKPVTRAVAKPQAQSSASQSQSPERKMPKLTRINVQSYSSPPVEIASSATGNTNVENNVKEEEIEQNFPNDDSFNEQFEKSVKPWTLQVFQNEEQGVSVEECEIKMEEVQGDCYILEVDQEGGGQIETRNSFEVLDDEEVEVDADTAHVVHIPYHPDADLEFEYEDAESADMYETDNETPGPAQLFRCNTCPSKFAFQFELEDHIKNCNLSRLRRSTNPQQQQMDRDNNDPSAAAKNRPSMQPKKCDQCGKILSTYSVWKNHILTVHLRQTKYKCTLCEFGCQRPGELENHMVVHSGERNFTCEYCNRAFRHKKNLTAHMRIHTGENRYQCAICLTRFRYHITLTRHLKNTHSIGEG